MLRKNNRFKIAITFLITVLFYLHSFAQNWDIPADKKSKNSYIPFTKETAKEGEVLYTKNCQSCHGNLGKDNSLKTLKPIPPDLSKEQTQSRTDGDLFYIITNGRLVMPSFKNIFSEEERWKLIAYVRSFNKKYIQVLSKTDPTKSKLVKISMQFDSLTYKFKVEVKANEKTGIVYLKEDEIALFANRYFGKLQIDSTTHTNNEGIAVFNIPKDLPGDKSGFVTVNVKVTDDIYGEIETQDKFKIGIPTDRPGLTEKRAIWNVLKKAPIWIIAIFTSILLIVGSFLLYIIYSMVKLKKMGNKQ